MPPITATLLTSPPLLLSLLSSLSYTLLIPSRPSRTRTFTKTLSTLLLALTTHLNPSSPALLTYGLALSSLGDFFLALSDTAPKPTTTAKTNSNSSDEDPFFLPGLLSFLLAHLLYTRLFLTQPHTPLPTLLTTSPSAWTLTALITTMLLVLIPRVGKTLRVPVAVYAVAIYVMGLSALALPAGREGTVVGAMMFVASDAVLAFEKFVVTVGPDGVKGRGWMGFVVWGLYFAGQGGIAVGF